MKLPPDIVVDNLLRSHYQAYRAGGNTCVPGFQVNELPGRVVRVSFQPAFPFASSFARQQVRLWKDTIEARGYRVVWRGPEEPVAEAAPSLLVHERPSGLDMQESIGLLRACFPSYTSFPVTPQQAAAYHCAERLQEAFDGFLDPKEIEEVWEATHQLLAGELPRIAVSSASLNTMRKPIVGEERLA